MYPFLRTQKIIYMPQVNIFKEIFKGGFYRFVLFKEYDNIQTFPCEVLPGIMYIGSSKQAHDKLIHKELKIRAHINISHEKDML